MTKSSTIFSYSMCVARARDAVMMFAYSNAQAIPERYSKHGLDSLDEYFAMGRGHQKDGVDVPSLVG